MRNLFEVWISGPPYEKSADRYPDEGLVAWPGQYHDLTVQLAWEAWRDAWREAACAGMPAEPRVVTEKPQEAPGAGDGGESGP